MIEMPFSIKWLIMTVYGSEFGMLNTMYVPDQFNLLMYLIYMQFCRQVGPVM